MHHKRILLLIVALLLSAAVVTAQETDSAQEATISIETLTFASLNIEVEELRDPVDSVRYRFHLPDTWELTDAAQLTLDVDITTNLTDLSSAVLEIYVNNIYFETLLLNAAGGNTLSFTIPMEYLTPYLDDGRHEIYLLLDAADYCHSSDNFIMIVDDSSSVEFTYTTTDLPLDLRAFPRPLLQDSFLTDRVMVVVPDNASPEILTAALNTMAALGNLESGATTEIELRHESALDDDVLANHHLIYVGLAEYIGTLNLELDFPVIDGAFTGFDHSEDDGILQLALSPRNAERVILVVSGETALAVNHAARTLSYGDILPHSANNLSVITALQTQMPPIVSDNSVITFAEAGYDSLIVDAPFTTLFYNIDIPFGSQIVEGNRLTLDMSHSSLLDYQASGVAVRVNGEPYATVELSTETENITSVQIELPPRAFHTGLNEVALDIQLIPDGECIDRDSGLLWLRVDNTSRLTVPFEDDVELPDALSLLRDYPEPFTLTSALSSTVFVLPSTPENRAWETAGQVARQLGNRVPGKLFDLTVLFDDSPDDSVLANNHLIVIGDSSHPFIPVMEEQFESIDFALSSVAKLGDVSFQVSEPNDIGHLQLHRNPWNGEFVVFSAIADTSQGLMTLATTLNTDTTRRSLSGNFALVNGGQIIVDTVASFEPSPDEDTIQVISEASEGFAFDSQSRLSILVIGGMLLLVIVVIISAIVLRLSNIRQTTDDST